MSTLLEGDCRSEERQLLRLMFLLGLTHMYDVVDAPLEIDI